MQIKKIVLPLSILTSTGLIANDKTSYDYVDLSYGYSGTSLHRDDVYQLDLSYSLNDNWYLSVDFDRLLIDYDRLINNSIYSRNLFSFSLGFHQSIMENTDFYAELGYENSEVSVPFYNTSTSAFENFNHTQNDFIASIGTRTKFNDKFELITEVKYANRDYLAYPLYDSSGGTIGFNQFDNDNINYGISGLYHLNQKNALKLGAHSADGLVLGWRYNW